MNYIVYMIYVLLCAVRRHSMGNVDGLRPSYCIYHENK